MNKQDFMDRLRMALNGRVSPGLVMDNVNYYEDYITLPLILSVVNGLWYSLYIYIFRFLIRGRLNLPYYFIKIMLPEIIFTAVTTLLVYRLFLSASRRLEDIGKRRDTTIV